MTAQDRDAIRRSVEPVTSEMLEHFIVRLSRLFGYASFVVVILLVIRLVT
jgi:hypothetical protein